MTHGRSRRLAIAVAAATLSLPVAGAGPAASEPVAGCPALYVLGIQGTGESSADASTTTDSGMLASVMSPMLTMAGSKVAREYVPYEAGFGGAVPGGAAPFQDSAEQAVETGLRMAEEKLSACPSTRLAAVGYSQGAYALRLILNRIAQGESTITPDRVAAAAAFSEPSRTPGQAVFAAGGDEPAPVPGTDGTAVDSIGPVLTAAVTGGGIAPTRDGNVDLGELGDRFASFCTSGDLACDAPEHAPLLHVVTNIAGQSSLNPNDPVAALTTLAEAVALTSWKTAVPVINDDISGKSLDTLSYTPRESISRRLAAASDPRTPTPSAEATIAALFKVGTIGLNAVTTVVKKVFTLDTIASLATVGLANPVAAVGTLATKVGQAVIELVPPATQSRLLGQAWTAVKQNITDNRDLLDVTNLLRYSATVASHGSYGSVAASPTGDAPVAWVAKWFAAAANDIAGQPFTATDPNGGIYVDPGDPARFPASTTSTPVTTSPPQVSSTSTVPTTTTEPIPDRPPES